MDKKSIDVIYVEAKRMLEIQYDGSKSITNRLHILIGFNSVVVAAIFQSRESNIFVSIGLLIILIGTVIALYTNRSQKLKNTPKPTELIELYKNKDVDYIKSKLAGTWGKNYRYNKGVIVSTEKLLFICTLLTVLGIGIISFPIISEGVMQICKAQ